MKGLSENGDGYREAAVLEIGYVDVEVNIYTYAQCVMNADTEDQTPLIDYFTCSQHGENKDDWSSDGYLDYSLNVDWNAENWRGDNMNCPNCERQMRDGSYYKTELHYHCRKSTGIYGS